DGWCRRHAIGKLVGRYHAAGATVVAYPYIYRPHGSGWGNGRNGGIVIHHPVKRRDRTEQNPGSARKMRAGNGNGSAADSETRERIDTSKERQSSGRIDVLI